MPSNTHHLAHASARAARRPGFLAWTFATYREVEHLSDEELRRILACSVDDYHRLALCRMVAQPSAEDLRGLAAFAGADLDALARVLRRAEAVAALREAEAAASRSTLLAAREREEDEETGDDDERTR